MLPAIAILLACILVLYILFGYPLLLSFLAARWGKAVQRTPIHPRVTVIIAVHNGEAFIADKLRSVLDLNYPPGLIEIIVASDGSTDRTEQITANFEPAGVRLLRLPRGGKPAALNAAIPVAQGEILVLTDVRQELDPDSVSLLMENFADPSVGVASGDLRIRQGETPAEANIGLYRRYETFIRDRLSAIDSMFGATGAIYAIRRKLAARIPPDMLLDDMFLPLAAFFKGYRLVMDTRAKAWDEPTSLETEFRRKIRTLAGNYQILRAYPALLSSGNRMRFHFVSHKLARILLPWILLAIAAISLDLPAGWRAMMFTAQSLFYGLAAIDSFIPTNFALKRLSSPARTFVVMMIAAIAALSIFFVPARKLWKVTSTGNLAGKPDGAREHTLEEPEPRDRSNVALPH